MSIKKPILQKLASEKDSSFVYHRYVTPLFETPWHFHTEFEIVLCDGGFGNKFVGNHSSTYREDDLMLLGSNLPHWYKADNSFYESPKTQEGLPASIVIQFTWDSFGKGFFDIHEMKAVKDLLLRADKGFEFSGETRDKLNTIIRENIDQAPQDRLITLLKILTLMSNTAEITPLSEIGMLGMSNKDSDRMRHILSTVMSNYHKEINLDQLGKEVGLTKAAFCRYFKARTQKTFVNYLNEIRINHVCEYLRNSDRPITEIAYECGFTNISNFNRQFKELLGSSPKDFRKNLG
jgi:AraC-like DNA-binding protein